MGKTKFSAKAVELMRNPYLADDLVDFHLMSAWVPGKKKETYVVVVQPDDGIH